MTRWLPWPRDPRYLVSDDGEVHGPSGRLLGEKVNKRGYRAFSVWIDGRRAPITVHVVVCETYHGPRPPGKEAAHENGVLLDCRAVNLAWKTHVENCADRVTHGTAPLRERNGRARLTAAQVREIRASSESITALARRFSVGWSTIKDARTGRRWGSLL